MSWRWSGTGLLLLAGAACLTARAVYVLRYRRGPAGTSLVVVLAATIHWSVVYAAELAAPDVDTAQFLGGLKYIGLVVLPPASLVFVLQYAGRLRRPSRLLLGCWRWSRWWCCSPWPSPRPTSSSTPTCPTPATAAAPADPLVAAPGAAARPGAAPACRRAARSGCGS